MTKFVMNYNVMKNLATILRKKRLILGLRTKDIAISTKIDQSLISKFESGNRIPAKNQLSVLASAYKLPFETLKNYWASEKLSHILHDSEWTPKLMMVMEGRMEYLTSQSSLSRRELSKEIKERLDTLSALQAKWNSIKPLEGLQLNKLRSYFNIKYTHESNKIEGNTLTLMETKLVIEDGLTIGGKSITEHLEAINHAHAIDFIESLVSESERINQRTLLQIHGLILSGIDRDNAGLYRRVPVRITGSEHVPPQPYIVGKLMEEYFIHYENQKELLHPVILAAEMHERLVTIHPFIDGNGRTSRLLMNLILLQNGYTIANLKGDQHSRLAYYEALEKMRIENEVEIFYNFIIDAATCSLQEHIDAVA